LAAGFYKSKQYERAEIAQKIRDTMHIDAARLGGPKAKL
jgi:hypothetical protein